MATKIETLERVLLYKIILDSGDVDKLKGVIDEVIEEARSARGKPKPSDD